MFGITRKPTGDPMFDLLYNLERRMGRFVPDPFAGFEWRPLEVGGDWMPPVDIFDEPGALRIVAEIPGVKPEDVKISVEGNVLTIHGTKAEVFEEKAEKVHRHERTYGAFERTFTLPSTVDAGAIKATYEMGLLTISLPKVEKAKPREIKVEVAGKALKG